MRRNIGSGRIKRPYNESYSCGNDKIGRVNGVDEKNNANLSETVPALKSLSGVKVLTASSVNGKGKHPYYNNNEKFSRGTVYKSEGKYNGKDEQRPKREYRDKYHADERFHKLVRRVINEEDRERCYHAARDLRHFVCQPENSKHYSVVSDNTVTSLSRILYERVSRDTKQEVAIIVGVLASVSSNQLQRYLTWLFSKIHSSSNEVRVLLLASLYQIMKCDYNHNNLEESMLMVMKHCQDILEKAETADVLVGVVTIINSLAQTHQHIFADYFKDTVDILVGWHIDATQPEHLIQFTSEALVSFHLFWKTEFNFFATLMGQFIEDMEAYAEDLALGMTEKKLDDDIPPPCTCVVKLSALIRVFSTIVKSLGEFFHAEVEESCMISVDYVKEFVERIIHCVTDVYSYMQCNLMLKEVNLCTCLLLQGLHVHTTAVSHVLVPYLITLLGVTNQPMHTHTVYTSALKLLNKYIEHMSTHMPVEFVTQLLAHNSVLMKLRFSIDKQVVDELMMVVHALLRPRSVPLLEEVYKHLLSDLELSFNTLLDTSSDWNNAVHLVSENCYSNVEYDSEQACVAAIFNICALSELGNTKNNLIAMWALSPNIFDLLLDHILEPMMTQLCAYPALLYSAVHTLLSHCQRHNYYLASCSFTDNLNPSSMMSNSFNSSTSQYTKRLIKFITKSLMYSKLPYDTRMLYLSSTQDIFENLAPSCTLCTSTHFQALVNSIVSLGFHGNTSISHAVCRCLMLLLSKCEYVPDKRFKDLSILRLSCSDTALRNEYLQLMALLPLDMTLSIQLDQLYSSDNHSRREPFSTESQFIAHRTHMSRNPTRVTPLSSAMFKSIMAGIFDEPRDRDNSLQSIYHMTHRMEEDIELNKHRVHLLVSQIDSSSRLQCFWASWEAAMFCVSAKLRTPLGKPQDTFAFIEKGVKMYAQSLRNLHEGGQDRHVHGAHAPLHKIQQRARSMMEFMEYLEKLLYNAYEGTALSIGAPSKIVRHFFRTNKGTCQEWLLRVRMNLIILGLYGGNPAMAVHHAFTLLQDMVDGNSTHLPDFQHVIKHAVEALCTLHCPSAIVGLYHWSKQILGTKLKWVLAAVDVASEKYEHAAGEYQTVLKNYLSPDGAGASNSRDSPVHTDNPPPDNRTQKFSILSKSGSNKQVNIPPSPETGRKTPGQTNANADPVIARFLVQQVCKSYESLSDWREVQQWQQSVQQYRTSDSDTKLQTALRNNIDINYVKALSSFDGYNFTETREHLELIPGASVSDIDDQDAHSHVWHFRNGVTQAEKYLLRFITYCMTTENIFDHTRAAEHLYNDCVTQCKDILHVQSYEWPPTVCQQVVMIKDVADMVMALLKGDSSTKVNWLSSQSSYLHLDPSTHKLHNILQAMSGLSVYAKCFAKLKPDGNTDFTDAISNLQISTGRLARKTSNYKLSQKLIITQLSSTTHDEADSSVSTDKLYTTLTTSVPVKSQNGAKLLNRIILEREGAKLLSSQGEHKKATIVMLSAVEKPSLNDVQIAKDSMKQTVNCLQKCRDLQARSILNIAKWLQADSKYLAEVSQGLSGTSDGTSDGSADGTAGDEITDICNKIRTLISMESRSQLPTVHCSVDISAAPTSALESHTALTDADLLINDLLKLATERQPNLSKSWFTLAGACYKWGRKAVDSASNGTVELSSSDKEQIQSLLPSGTSEAEVEAVLTIMCQVHAGQGADEDISDQDQSLYDDGTEVTRRQLLSSCMTLQIASEETMDSLLLLWRQIIQRVYHYYHTAIHAYFIYLKLNDQNLDDSVLDGNTTATLRVLRLLVKHAWELQMILEDGLAHTPTAPWKGIIPQLFSRLNHPESYVRRSVSDLLCRLASDAPHLVVYPAVVGCTKPDNKDINETNRDGVLNAVLSQGTTSVTLDNIDDANNSQTDSSDAINNDVLQNCFAALVNTLSTQNPKMINEVQLIVQELRRITVLWEELWLGTLNQHHQDVNRRLAQLETEVTKVQDNVTLTDDEKTAIIKQKHVTVLKPTVFTMERLQELTSRAPETPNEASFQREYAVIIEKALTRLRNPPDPKQPHNSWTQGFKLLHRSLQERANKRSSLLQMDQISAKLANLANTAIPMPGIADMGSQLVTIESVHNTIQILPTKTKPKKLMFIGSDGKRYPYLFKGLEDLHLDERIMQFLSIVNNMFAKSNKNIDQLYRARHYSVTPLGSRSGLIQWVDGATPLFTPYKRWQQREALAQQLKTTGPTNSRAAAGSSTRTMPSHSNASMNIQRPSEIYYGKLTPALKDVGINSLDNRKEWPVNVQKQVLQQLEADTPADLLAKELWCSSISSSSWWEVTQMYNRSTAVMSIIGYIIGLGDRHLDNVLIDFTKGEVVHIDHNVCFEKGRHLRVPEKVPFRMTQNIEAALGVTGVEGTFRLSCEHVLRTMRRGRETLLTLLEAFVYDPLVDWTTTNEAGYTGAFYGGDNINHTDRQSKHEMECEITHSMFSIRMSEMRVSWLSSRDAMVAALPTLVKLVHAHQTIQSSLRETAIARQGYKKLQTFVNAAQEEAAAAPGETLAEQHPLCTLTNRYKQYTNMKSLRTSLKESLHQQLTQWEKWKLAHDTTLQSLQDNSVQKLYTEITLFASSVSSESVFNCTVEFLQSSGQAQLLAQCETSEADLNTVLQQTKPLINTAIPMLNTLATVLSQFPRSYSEMNRCSMYVDILKELSEEITTAKANECLEMFMYRIASHCDTEKGDYLVQTEHQIDVAIQHANEQLKQLIARRKRHDSKETSKLTLELQEAKYSLQIYCDDAQTPSAPECIISVLFTKLCELLNLYTKLETSSTVSESWVNIVTPDHDSYLEGFYTLSANIKHTVGLFDVAGMKCTVNNEMLNGLQSAISSVDNVFEALQDMYINFCTIIMPEAKKLVHSCDDSITMVIQTVLDLFSVDGNKDLKSLQKVLYDQIEFVKDGIEVDGSVLEQVHRIRDSYRQFLKGTSNLTAGHMLLMAYDGLFVRLHGDQAAMLEVKQNITTKHPVQSNVDVLLEAVGNQRYKYNEQLEPILSALMFVEQLDSIQLFFTSVENSTHTSKTGDISQQPYCTEEKLIAPMQTFITNFIKNHIIGTPSTILCASLLHCVQSNLHYDITEHCSSEDICDIAVLCDAAVGHYRLAEDRQRFTVTQLASASQVLRNVEEKFTKSNLARLLDNNIVMQRATVQRLKLEFSCFYWLYGDLMKPTQTNHKKVLCETRHTTVAQLTEISQQLSGRKSELTSSLESFLTTASTASGRLKWASGANPATIQPVQEQYEKLLKNRQTQIQRELSTIENVINWCNVLVHFENYRGRSTDRLNPDILRADDQILALINRCVTSCESLESSNVMISEEEQRLMLHVKSWPCEISREHLENTSKSMKNAITRTDQSIQQLQTNVNSAKDDVKQQVSVISSLLSAHHHLMTDVRSILKSIAKQEEISKSNQPTPYDLTDQSSGSDSDNQIGPISRYIAKYRKFSEQYTGLLKLLSELSESQLSLSELYTGQAAMGDVCTLSILEAVQLLQTCVPSIYDDLLKLTPPLLTDSKQNDGDAQKSSNSSTIINTESKLIRQQELEEKTSGVPVGKRISRDPRTGRVIQHRNTYAVGVWRRVKAKLDGRDSENNKRMSVNEQVDFVIRESTNRDNLAVMYEGWTAWV